MVGVVDENRRKKTLAMVKGGVERWPWALGAMAFLFTVRMDMQCVQAAALFIVIHFFFRGGGSTSRALPAIVRVSVCTAAILVYSSIFC